jgi:hypothetical protein
LFVGAAVFETDFHSYALISALLLPAVRKLFYFTSPLVGLRNPVCFLIAAFGSTSKSLAIENFNAVLCIPSSGFLYRLTRCPNVHICLLAVLKAAFCPRLDFFGELPYILSVSLGKSFWLRFWYIITPGVDG